MRILVAATLVATMSFGFTAGAQILLHNGPDAAPEGGASAPAGTGPAPDAPAKPKPILMKPPAEDAVLGHDLLRNGANGLMTLARQGKDIGVTHLSFEGEEISKPGEPCHVEISEGLPIATHFSGRPDGLSRYQVDLQACPFSFDVLEGAVLVPKGHACDFTAADCHVDPAGVWGPQGNTINQTHVKEMEQSRIRIESEMRADFKVLLSRAGKNKFEIKRIAGEQAGFSSERETVCHSYALESVHGFCALEMTRARVLALLAQLGTISDTRDDAKPPGKKKPKPPALAAQPPAPAAAE